jgi:hypothetical protein
MNAWDHLPNARHINLILNLVDEHPKSWIDINSADYTIWTRALRQAWSDTGTTAVKEARDELWYSTSYPPKWSSANKADAVERNHRVRIWEAARTLGRSACLALMAYEDCAHYLDLSSDKLQFIADLSGHPAPRLLLPAVKAFEAA